MTHAKSTLVSETPAADAATAAKHFATLLSLETDCWDVHESMQNTPVDFVLLDVRGKGGFEAGHIPGASHMPRGELTELSLTAYPADTLFVVYCAGPHCNGADKAALRLAQLGRQVKKMIGGIEGWKDEGFALISR